MKEIARILDLWSGIAAAGEEAVLATVVKTQGSSYRLPGARMLLSKRGQRAGAISGGCLEDDLAKKAWWLTESGAVVKRYDTTPDNEIATSGFGLGCSGIVHALIERVKPGDAEILDVIRRVRATRKPLTVAHVLKPSTEVGKRLFDETEFAAEGREVFIERLQPAMRLLIFGAGDDAAPLTECAKYLGWEVEVLDGRSHYARRERFPHADRVRVRRAGEPLPDIDTWTVAVLMSHSYSQDLEALGELAGQPLAYLGILGPGKRTQQLLDDARIERASIDGKLHGPMGLDIGADGPEQVAIAVVAEIQARLNGREGGSLSARTGWIHARSEDSSDAWTRSIVCA